MMALRFDTSRRTLSAIPRPFFESRGGDVAAPSLKTSVPTYEESSRKASHSLRVA